MSNTQGLSHPLQKLTIAEVVLDAHIDYPLDYLVPESMLSTAKEGKRVLIPLQGRLVKGTIFQLKVQDANRKKLLALEEILSEEPLLPRDLLQLAEWMSCYYCSSLSKVLKFMLPGSLRKETKQKTQLFIKGLASRAELVELCKKLQQTSTPQAKALEIILQHPKGILLSKLLEMGAITRSPVDTLVKKGYLSSIALSSNDLDQHQEYFLTKPKTLNPQQQEALEEIKKNLRENRFSTHLIHGITGSGKTEIYLQAIEYALTLGKSSIFLVPEIALTSQTLERLRSRFSENIALLHHRLSDGERNKTWDLLLQGKCLIAIGARSAIFSPVKSLGLIIVDEEHEPAYKQNEENPCFHARDLAVMRGKMTQAVVLLGSATPSLESYHNALKGKYCLNSLTVRADKAHLPKVTLVDMAKECQQSKGFTLFSETLLKAIKTRIGIGEQIILFLNRRGYHTSQICQSCAHVIKCPHCEVSLTFHKGENVLACHLCDFQLTPPPRQCPQCHSSETLKYKGVGTENVENSLRAIFPQCRTLRLDADTTKHKGSHELAFKQFRSGKADVLIGTQMIAKGLHFPSVTLVGVLNADASLNIPDFRASEQVFQLLTQVSGRSGRGALKGEVIIQTHLPDQPTIQLAAREDYRGFYEQEIAVRQLFKFPPFCHLVKFIFSGKSVEQTELEAQKFRKILIETLPADYEIHPVIPCGHTKVKNLFRYQLLMKYEKPVMVKKLLAPLFQQFKPPSGVRLFIDVDPLSTFF